MQGAKLGKFTKRIFLWDGGISQAFLPTMERVIKIQKAESAKASLPFLQDVFDLKTMLSINRFFL